MSRTAKNPITIPSEVEFHQDIDNIKVKGKLGEMQMKLNPNVILQREENTITFNINEAKSKEEKYYWSQAGTARANIANFIQGVSQGWEKKLILTGVGYRAQVQGKALNLVLGFSHPISYQLPDGVSAQTPSQNEIILKGIDKQKVGQVASEIRAFRPPEPYKGKGIRYSDENIVRKEAKKK